MRFELWFEGLGWIWFRKNWINGIFTSSSFCLVPAFVVWLNRCLGTQSKQKGRQRRTGKRRESRDLTTQTEPPWLLQYLYFVIVSGSAFCFLKCRNRMRNRDRKPVLAFTASHSYSFNTSVYHKAYYLASYFSCFSYLFYYSDFPFSFLLDFLLDLLLLDSFCLVWLLVFLLALPTRFTIRFTTRLDPISTIASD